MPGSAGAMATETRWRRRAGERVPAMRRRERVEGKWKVWLR